MATITTLTSTVACAAMPRRLEGISSSPIPMLGLPQIRVRGGRVRCFSEAKPSVASGSMGVSLLAAASVMSVSNPVLALVDERMSTEGTGLGLGISNNLLGWILLGVFGLIWALYFAYTSTLEEDEESGLSL
ncbi:photosystem II reaction center W protein, chloroplastic [Elaeis guineensis]|uniref:PSII 6.1 kDa protein n=1 Tax=Elaeis guineensis var. tenera TaxID=51953 RepID=A0A6I9S4H1_ELAGV|nr:photosystem II reaction center W protein, chloroplastic [Elaeis guineensis]